MRKTDLFITSLLVFTLSSCVTNQQELIHLQQDWQKWRNEYKQEVSGKDGWLSLAGLYWLNEGQNSIGSNETMDHQFPSDAPERVGTINIKGDTAHFFALTHPVYNGETRVLAIPLSVKDKTRLSFGDYSFFLIKREKGFAIRLINNSLIEDAKAKYLKLSFYPFSEQWRIPARLIPNKKPKKIRMATVYGTTREDNSAGMLSFTLNGKDYQLEAVDYGKETPMYVMFSDETNGDLTYSAGRYVEVHWPENGDLTFIDFNRSYNPPCAYTPYATCPLTPKQNILSVPINAGELDYKIKP